MTKKMRTRFAPSPTGFLHIGGLRTLLFAYFIAKTNDGELILRIEDTDQKREVEGAVQKLIDIIDWTGIKFDEGPHIDGDFGPYIQTQRLDIYQKYIKKLIDSGNAYYCFCTEERIKKLREEQKEQKIAPRYDEKCRNLSKEEIEKKIKNGEKYVIRQKIPHNTEIITNDELRGEIKFNSKNLNDHILMKSNGIPTYQFAVVVDDYLMEITHIVRGEEWIASLPKNVLLYQAFNWEIPKFIHLPLIMNKEGGKLSKRHSDVSVENYKDKGYLPEALINFTMLLGWHPKEDIEILNNNEIEKKFNLKNIKTSSSIFDIDKLDFFNNHYIKKLSVEELTKLCTPYLKNKNNPLTQDNEYIKNIIKIEQERLRKISDIKEMTELFFTENIKYDKELLIWKTMDKDNVRRNLDKILNLIQTVKVNNWTKEKLEDIVINYIKNNNEKVGEFLWPMRVSLTGQKNSPSPFEVAFCLGKDRSIKRITDAINLV